jgi:hypothetical protein
MFLLLIIAKLDFLQHQFFFIFANLGELVFTIVYHKHKKPKDLQTLNLKFVIG